MGWFVLKTLPNDHVSFRAHALVGTCDREWWLPCWCYVAWSGLLLPWYCGRWWLYIKLTKTWTPCLWRNWLVSQVIGSFSSPDWCVSWNAPRAAVSEALAIDIRGAERYLLQAQCLFQQDAHRILQDDLLSVVVLPSKLISSHVQFFHVNKQWWAHLLIVGIVTFPAIFYLWRFQVCKFTSWCSFACLVGTSKQQNFAYRGSPLRQDIYIYISSWEAMDA